MRMAIYARVYNGPGPERGNAALTAARVRLGPGLRDRRRVRRPSVGHRPRAACGVAEAPRRCGKTKGRPLAGLEDRAFRSLLDAAQTLERLRGWKVGIRSYQEPWIDTTSPIGEAMFGITAVWAQLERAILRERVKAGMERARRERRRLSRPRVADMPSVARDWPMVRSRIESGEISRQTFRMSGASAR